MTYMSTGDIGYKNLGLANFTCQIYIPENFKIEKAYLTLFQMPVSYRGNGTGVGYVRNSLVLKAQRYDDSTTGYVLLGTDSTTGDTTMTFRQSFDEYSLAVISPFPTPSGGYQEDQNIEIKTVDFSNTLLSQLGTNTSEGFWTFTAGYTSNPAPSEDSNYWNIMKYTGFAKGYVSIQGYYILK